MKFRHELTVYGSAVLLAFVVAYQFIKPAPPDHVCIASGGPQGAYYAFARAYARELAKEGIRLEVLNTAGSVENIRLLREGRVDAALVQGGIPDEAGNDGALYSLGSLYYEPLWLFVRRDLAVSELRALKGLRITVGATGSGTRALALALRLLRDNGVTAVNSGLRLLGGKAAAQGLQQGGLDAAFFVVSPQSPLAQSLLHAADVRPASFERAEAYARRYRFLNSVTLPRGVVDLEQDLPPADVRLLAPTANLVVRAATHPAINGLLLQAMERVHAEGDWFAGRGGVPPAGPAGLSTGEGGGSFLSQRPPSCSVTCPSGRPRWSIASR